MKRLVVLTGAGISEESGLKTFRNGDGLWAGHRIEEVAHPDGFLKNPQKVMDFYNERRREVRKSKPNNAHRVLAELENYFDVTIITQNIDDLHERAGSSRVIHLHGNIHLSRSIKDSEKLYKIEEDLNWGDTNELGVPLRPDVVWFSEDVPLLYMAANFVSIADIFVVIGTSLQVYPAASLINHTQTQIPKYMIDKNIPHYVKFSDIHSIEEKASSGINKLKEHLLKNK